MRDPKAIIYSDSDGVICDFLVGAAKALGHPWKNRAEGVILNQYEGFWENLPTMPDFHTYWSFVSRYNPHILTAVPGGAWTFDFRQVERGKREWYRKHLPSIPQSHIHIVYREEKANYARNGQVRNILIDDHVENVQEFERAGGIGIHHVSARVTILKLKELGYH